MLVEHDGCRARDSCDGRRRSLLVPLGSIRHSLLDGARQHYGDLIETVAVVVLGQRASQDVGDARHRGRPKGNLSYQAQRRVVGIAAG